MEKKAKTLLVASLFATTALSSLTHSVCASDDINESLLAERKTATPLWEEVISNTASNVKSSMIEKGETLYRLAQKSYSGDYSEIAGEVINYALAMLADQQDVVLFRNANREFDDHVLEGAANKFADRFVTYLMRLVNRDKSQYGLVRGSGDIVDIYRNRTLFSLLADLALPENVPMRGALIGMCNNQIIENLLRQKVVNFSVKFLKDLAKARNTSLKEVSGQFIATAIPDAKDAFNEFMSAESDFDMGAVWKYVGPYFAHYLRSFSTSFLDVAAREVGKKMDQHLRGTVINAGRAVGGALTIGSGYALEALGSVFPYVGVPLSYAGSWMQGTVGMIGGGYTGGVMSNALIDATGNSLDTRFSGYLNFLTHALIPYSAEEHALFGLNPNPSDIERAMFSADYALQEEMRQQYFVPELLRAFARGEKSLLEGAFEAVQGNGYFQSMLSWFSTNPDGGAKECLEHIETEHKNSLELSGVFQGYVDAKKIHELDQQRHAYRRYLAEKMLKTDQAKELETAIQKFPSYALHQKRMDMSKAQNRHTLSHDAYVVNMLEVISWDIEAESDVSSKDVWSALMDLSVIEQDTLVDMKENRDGYDALEMALSEKKDNFLSVVKQAIRAYSEKKNAQYFVTHKDEIESLFHSSMGEGLEMQDMIYLHKKLSTKPHLKQTILSHKKDKLDCSDSELVLVEQYFMKGVALQKAVELNEWLFEELAKNEAFAEAEDCLLAELKEKTPQELLAEKYRSAGQHKKAEDAQNLSDEEALYPLFASAVDDTTAYKEIMLKIRAERDQEISFKAEVQKQFATVRAGKMKLHFEDFIKKYTAETQPLVISEEVNGSSGLFGFFSSKVERGKPLAASSSQASDIDKGFEFVSSGEELYSEKRKTVSAYDPTDVGVFNLFEEAKKLNFSADTIVEEMNLTQLLKQIWDSKIEKLEEKDRDFAKQFYHELVSTRQHAASDQFEGRLFYSLPSLIQALRLENQRLIRLALSERD